jgi:hypothetical protein
MDERRIDGPALLDLVREVVDRGGLIEIRVHGHSMFPTLANGDRVTLGPRRRGRGALVLADIDGRPVLHRVAQIAANRVFLRADASRREDWVELGQLCAEVRAVRRQRPRRLARLLRLLRARAGLLRITSFLRLAVGSDQLSGEMDAGSPSRL